MAVYRAPKTIQLSPDMMGRCREFAREMAPLIQAKEFNEDRRKPRSAEETEKDLLIGKIAECAVWEYCAAAGLDLEEVDFEVKGASQRDDYDVKLKDGRHLSVKSTVYGRWLMVHRGNIGCGIADYYVLCATHLLNGEHTGRVTVQGWCASADLINSDAHQQGVPFGNGCVGAKSKYFAQEAPWGGPLDAPNLGIHSQNLEHDLDSLINELQNK